MIKPSARSISGLTVCWALLVPPDEPPSDSTITRPSVMLVIIAPSRYPSSRRFGLGRTSITVTAPSSVGLNAAASARTTTCPRSVLRGAGAVGHEPVKREDVHREDRQRPERVGRHQQQLRDRVQRQDPHARPAGRLVLQEDAGAGDPLDDSEDENDPAPRVQAAHDELVLVDEELGVADRRYAFDEVERAEHEQQPVGERDPAVAAPHVVVDVAALGAIAIGSARLARGRYGNSHSTTVTPQAQPSNGAYRQPPHVHAPSV